MPRVIRLRLASQRCCSSALCRLSPNRPLVRLHRHTARSIGDVDRLLKSGVTDAIDPEACPC